MSAAATAALERLRELREEFASRSLVDVGNRDWMRLPKHHRLLLLTLEGQPDKYASKAWCEIPEDARRGIGSTARVLAKSLSACACGLV
jgi:hypothetical protein